MLFLFVLYSMELAKKKFAVMSYEIIQFFKTSRKESIYHTFMHETIIIVSSLPFLQGARGERLKNFQCWQKGGDLHFLDFKRGVSKKRVVDFFREGV